MNFIMNLDSYLEQDRVISQIKLEDPISTKVDLDSALDYFFKGYRLGIDELVFIPLTETNQSILYSAAIDRDTIQYTVAIFKSVNNLGYEFGLDVSTYWKGSKDKIKAYDHILMAFSNVCANITYFITEDIKSADASYCDFKQEYKKRILDLIPHRPKKIF